MPKEDKTSEDTLSKDAKPRTHVREQEHEPARTSRKKPAIIAAIAAVVVCIACVVAVGMPSSLDLPAQESLSVSDISQAPSTDQELEKNPINFQELQERNSDIYAWLYVPGTEVNLPILQSGVADNYYLYHNIDGEGDPVGATYTQSQNNLTFTDPVTVVYGHTFQPDDERADLAFGTLHNYEDKAFFDEHPYFYIYTPTKMFTYRVVSAYEYDNSHILNTHDFSDSAVLQRYLDLVVNPEDADANKSEIEKLTAGQAYVVQLSTCTRPSVSENRYIVSGVMVGEHNYKMVDSLTAG
ncbi:MAG: class B sortase [Eggerthellaceae bacterium]|nr:class B sortase [Eggerthellaceae bacterium]